MVYVELQKRRAYLSEARGVLCEQLNPYFVNYFENSNVICGINTLTAGSLSTLLSSVNATIMNQMLCHKDP